MDDDLWRGLPYQTLACIYSTIIEFVDMKRGPDAIAVCDLVFPSWHR
jgi:coproporphyrinogen III oxidase-like Fe-S oxidoreductase